MTYKTPNIKLAICGLGNVGGNLNNLLYQKNNIIKQKSNYNIKVPLIASRKLNHNLKLRPETTFTKDILKVASEPNIDIIVETLGGNTISLELIREAIKNGKIVISANKLLLAEHGNELFSLASKHNTHILFEASVGGGIPIIKYLKESITCNDIKSIKAICNGTCNFILTKMQKDNLDFKSALKQAQIEGCAEKDPALDIGGIDAAHKLAIIAAIAFGSKIEFNSIYIKGIEDINLEHIQTAQKFGFTIKHLCICKLHKNHQYELKSTPTLIKSNHPIANIDYEENAFFINSDLLNNTMICGPGAGGIATASAIMSDIMDLIRSYDGKKYNYNIPALSFKDNSLKTINILDYKDIKNEIAIFIKVKNQIGIMEKICHIFTQSNINLTEILQTTPKKNTSYLFLHLSPCKLKHIENTIQEIINIPEVISKPIWIPIEY